MLNPIDAYYAGPVIMSLAVILALGIFFLPSLGISIRRLHDIGHSGLEYFLIFLPLANFYMLYLLFTAGDKHVNAYGIPEKFRSPYVLCVYRFYNYYDFIYRNSESGIKYVELFQ